MIEMQEECRNKTLKEFPTLPTRDVFPDARRRVTQRAGDENVVYRNAVLKDTKNSVRDKLSDIIDSILSD